jgi:hypothetical protein
LEARVVSGTVACIELLFLGFCLRIYRNRRPDQAARNARLAGDINRKYKAMVVEVGNAPEGRTGEAVLPVASMEDLMKVGQGLLKPVHHAAEEGTHIYWVYDDTKRYEYRLANGSVPHQAPTPPDRPGN